LVDRGREIRRGPLYHEQADDPADELEREGTAQGKAQRSRAASVRGELCRQSVKTESCPAVEVSLATREAALVGPDVAAIAANDSSRRYTDRKAGGGLCEGKALLGNHTMRLKLAGRTADSEFNQSEPDDLLRLLTETRGIERKLHPGGKHGFPLARSGCG
jgi:hypothetical protein